MPKTRRAAKMAKSQEDEEATMKKERTEKLRVYLIDFDAKVESYIQAMNTYGDKLCENIKNACSTEILKLPKPLRKMTIAEFFQLGGKLKANYDPTDDLILSVPLKKKNPERELLSSKSHKRTSSKQLHKRTNSSIAPSRRSSRARMTPSYVEPSPLKNTVKPVGKRKGSVQTSTINRTKFSFATPFTPKFDPSRFLKTPATGLRQIRPGEQVVLMSLSGSPLIPSGDMNDLAITMPLQEDKTTMVNSQMSLDNSTSTTNMQRKMKLLQKKLRDVAIAPSSSK